MKKLVFLLISVSFLVTDLSAQIKGGVTWFDAGLKVKFGGAGLYNKAIVDSDVYNYDLGLTNGFGVGLKLAMNYDNNGIVLEGMLSQGDQDIESGAENVNVKWKTTDIYLLYRNSANRGYFELGPKISLIRSVDFTNPDGSITDVSDNYQTHYSGVIGFGGNLLGSDGAFLGILGLRMEYGFTDAVSPDGLTAGHPVVDPSIYASGDASSNILFAGVVMELYWGIGYYAKSGCGGRSKLIRF